MVVLLDCLQIHQLGVTTHAQVDQTCPVVSIFDHIFSRRIFKNINQSDNSVVDAIGERFEVILPSHGVTQKWDFYYSNSLDDSFLFNTRDRIIRHHSVLRLTMRTDPGIFRIILGPIAGGHPQKYAVISSTHAKSGERCHPIQPLGEGCPNHILICPYNTGWYFSSSSHLPLEYRARVVLPSTQHIAGEGWPYNLVYL